MNITEREIDDPEKEGVILEYVKFTKEFALRNSCFTSVTIPIFVN